MLAQQNNESIMPIIEKCISKLEAKDSLSFEEQCIVTVLSAAVAPDTGNKVTQEYFEALNKSNPMDYHPFVRKFLETLPTAWQMNLSECGAIMCGLNPDGSEKEISQKPPTKESLTKTYIIRKYGTNEVKIGKSRDCTSRIRTLSNQSGARMEVLCIIERNIETLLHKQFINLRTIGEWFDDSKGEIATFAKMQKKKKESQELTNEGLI